MKTPKARNVTVTNLAEVLAARAALPDLFRPHKVNGKWRMARWSALAIARERRATILRGEAWPWDIPRKEVVKRVPFKGHRRTLERMERAEEVKRCMARMPAMIEEYRKNKKKKSKVPGLLALISTPREIAGVVERNVKRASKDKSKK
jgi:hypothetical protein